MPTTLISGQVTPSTQAPFANQQNFGQAIGEVGGWHPGISAPMVANFLNNAVREYYDRRLWYGLMRKGQLASPGYYSVGSITLVNGSASVQGTSTAWTASLNGVAITQQQLRVGFIAPPLNITGLDEASQIITLELPWALPNMTSSGYFISQYYYSIPNIKYITVCKNPLMMYRMWTNIPQALLENWDPSRLQMMYPRVLAAMPPDKDGNYQVELWPVPNNQQAFPYLAYCQPDNLTEDDDNFPPFARVDVIKARAVYETLLWRPKQNPAYSEATALAIAQQKLKEFEAGVESAARADEQLYRQDIVTWAESFPMAQMDWTTGILMGGAMMAAMSPMLAGDY